MEVINLYPTKFKNDTRFTEVNDVRKFLARVINLRANDQMDSETARDLGYLCNIMIKAMEVSSLEDRINLIEEQLNKSI